MNEIADPLVYGKKLKILLLASFENDAELIPTALIKAKLNFKFKQVNSKETYIDAIKNYQPDIVLSDHSLPQFNSLDALVIHTQVDVPVPFILVVGPVSEEFAVACIKLGADDYILKSNLSRLPSSISKAFKNYLIQNRRMKAEIGMKFQNDKLKKINHEMDSFIYTVSHNFRAPLKSLTGLVDFIKCEDLASTPSNLKYFNLMSYNLAKLDGTLKEILEYYKNARTRTESQHIDIEKIIESSWEEQRYTDGFDSIEKTVIVKTEYPFYADINRLKIILTNLILNAIQFRDVSKDKCRITIQAIIKKQKAIITIDDNGIGIESKFIPKIFDMFLRATIKSTGSGLGLYVVKEIIQKLNGKISVQSEDGVRTKFRVELPNCDSF